MPRGSGEHRLFIDRSRRGTLKFYCGTSEEIPGIFVEKEEL